MSLVDRAKNIIMSPKSEWIDIAQEPADMKSILTGYVIPMALIPAIATFIGQLFFGSGSFMMGIAMGLSSVVITILAVVLTAFVINALAPSFDSEKDLGRAMQLVAYSYTPAWVGGVLNIIPFLGILASLFGLYGVYLMYLGFPHIMNTPGEKVVVYMLVTLVILVIIYMILTAVIVGFFFAIFGLSVAAAL